MTAIGLIPLIVLLLVLGLLGLGVFGVILAISMALGKGRLGRALAISGLAFAALLTVPLVLWLSFSVSPTKHTAEVAMRAGENGTMFVDVGARSHSYFAGAAQPVMAWAISIRVVALVAVIVVLAMIFRRRESCEAANAGPRDWSRRQRRGGRWAALWVPVIIGVLAANGVFWRVNSRGSAPLIAPRPQTDIHALMNQTDAPRIALAPEVPAPPPAPAPHAAAPDGEAASAAGESQSSDATHAESVSEQSEAGEVASADESEQDRGRGRPGSPDEKPKQAQDADEKTPAWIHERPKRVGGNVQREVVATDEWSSEEECATMRDLALMAKTYAHIQEMMGNVPQRPSGYVFQLGVPQRFDSAWGTYCWITLSNMEITLDYVHREIAKDEYLQKIERDIGPMYKLYTQVEFSPTVDRELRSRWETHVRRGRLAQIGIVASSILSLLALVWGLLKFDTLTKGYYTKRLFLGVPAAIIVGLLFMSLFMGRVVR